MNKLLYRVFYLALLIPIAGFALGVGELEVQSRLNEPFRAQIELIYDDPAEVAGAEVELASAEDFQRAGIDRGQISVSLKFDVVRNEQGNYVIEVTSTSPVSDPFLDMLIEVEWANGRLLREYVALLDPPVSERQRTNVEVSALPEPEPQTAAPARQPTEPARSEQAPRETRSRPAAGAAGQTYGPVARGDTLWEIARDRRPDDSISVNQMMVMLLRMNPDAFFDDNINALRAGAILRLPSRDDFASLSEDADLSVRDQNELWNTYVRGRTPTTVPTVSEAGADAEYDTGRTAEPTAPGESRLELVPPSGTSEAAASQQGAAAAEQAALRNDLARAREDLISARQENEELQSRLDELERLSSRYERTLNLKDSELAQLREQLAQARREAADQPLQAFPEPQTAAEAPLDRPGAVTGDADDAEADLAGTSPADEQPGEDVSAPFGETGTVATGGETTGETAGTEPEAVATPQSDGVTPPPVRSDESDFVGGNILWLVVAGLLLAAAGAGFFLYRRRRADQDVDYAFAGAEPLSEPQEDDSGPMLEPGDELEVESEAPSEDEAALRAARDAEPDDPQNHLALLRHYYSRSERERFLAAAETMRGRVGDSHPAWMEVRAMGSNIAPGAALFAADDESDLDFELDSGDIADDENEQTRMMSASEIEEVDRPEEDDLDLGLGDFDIDGQTGERPAMDEMDADTELDFDLDGETGQPTDTTDDLDLDLDLDGSESVSGAATTSDPGDELDLDFGLDDDEDQTPPVEAGEESSDEEDLLGDLDLDLSDDSSEDDLGLDDLGFDTDETPAAYPGDDQTGDHTEFELEALQPEQTGGDRAGMDTAELDLGLGETDEPGAESQDQLPDTDTPSPEEAVADDQEDDFGDLELDLDEDVPAVAQAGDDDLTDLDLDDLDLSDASAYEGEDSADTKLDLAKAYIDMGDPDGARGMLEEVLAEGSDQQKGEAQQLLDGLKS